MDAALASCYAYGLHTATVVDVGLEKADITAISEFLIHEVGRGIAVLACGGEAMTQTLVKLLRQRGFTRQMCEQLKRSAICEILPPGTSLPRTPGNDKDAVTDPAAAASTGAIGSGPGQRSTAAAMGNAPVGPGPDIEVGEEAKDEDAEGVLDVASIVAGGKMSEFLARKEKEKAERAAAKKKGADAAAALAKPIRLSNSKRERNSFMFEDHALLDALKDQNLTGAQIAEAHAALDESAHKRQDVGSDVPPPGTDGQLSADGEGQISKRTGQKSTIRREVEVGVERFQAASEGILERIADAIHRTIMSVEEVNKRSELWDSLILVGNGSKVRGEQMQLLSPSFIVCFNVGQVSKNLYCPS